MNQNTALLATAAAIAVGAGVLFRWTMIDEEFKVIMIEIWFVDKLTLQGDHSPTGRQEEKKEK